MKKNLLKITSATLLSAQLLGTPVIANAAQTVTVPNTSISVKNNKSADKEARTVASQNTATNPATIREKLALDAADNQNTLTVTGQSPVAILNEGIFQAPKQTDQSKPAQPTELKNIVLFTPLTDDFKITENNGQVPLKIVIPNNQVTDELRVALTKATTTNKSAGSPWHDDADTDINTTDITPLGKVSVKDNIISWGVSDPQVAALLNGVNYKAKAKTTFTPTDQTKQTDVVSYLVINDEVIKSPNQTITYQKQDTPKPDTPKPDTPKPDTPATDQTTLNDAKKVVTQAIESNTGLTKDQKVALEKLADQTTSIDQLNAIGALAKTLTNAKTDASTNPNTSKNDLAAEKTVANKTIDQLKNLSAVQKSLYKQLINVSTTSNGINRLVEVAKFQDSEQAQPSEASANPAETSSSSSTPKSSRDTSLDNTGYAGGGVQPGTETGKTQADSNNSTSDPAKKSSDQQTSDPAKKASDQQTPDPAKSSSGKQGSSADSTSTQSADPNSTHNTGSEKMAQTGVKHVSFINWLSQLLHF